MAAKLDAERARLQEGMGRNESWRRWGPFLSDRQWATVREDYSSDGSAWAYFPHDHARSRVYRWGEDGLLGICDRRCRLCFAVALWNGRDPILKERLFGLTGKQGNHGEDVKECYFYLDATPTASYLKGLYKYPQAEYPYSRLVEENRRRSRREPEFELIDTGVFDDNRYFDVFVEYAKASPEDILIKITICNRGPELANIHLLPTLWFRNTWSWGRTGDDYWRKPKLWQAAPSEIRAEHETLGNYTLSFATASEGNGPELLFTENATNTKRLWDIDGAEPYVKDAFHRYVIDGERTAVNPDKAGTKAAMHYEFAVPAGGEVSVRLRLSSTREAGKTPLDDEFEQLFAQREREADEFYADIFRWGEELANESAPGSSTGSAPESTQPPSTFSSEERNVIRQAMAGLVWSCQFYHYIGYDWLEGDPSAPPPPRERLTGRNHDWGHLYARDVMSMPDKWEYPWFAAWDLAFHTMPYMVIDPDFAKRQLELVMSERFMHPNGQIPAYEWVFEDVNPPVHGWAVYRLYKMTVVQGRPDRRFLTSAFHKLLLGFTWWVNRKDPEGKNIFAGGFLGLDNIGIFDRSKPLPTGGYLQQADGTAWMAFYCANLFSMALELAHGDPAYEDIAYKFFEHFAMIISAINKIGGEGLWDDQDGFYYDYLVVEGKKMPLKVRSMVGLIPILAASVVNTEMSRKLPSLTQRLRWFMRRRPHLMEHLSIVRNSTTGLIDKAIIAIPMRDRLIRVLGYLLDENEFLSPYGIRSISKYHAQHPFIFSAGGQEYRVDYAPGESDTAVFGGNSNWRGPIWFPINYLLIEALETYYLFYGDDLKVECPTGSGRMMNLFEVAHELGRRLCGVFLPDPNGRRACHGDDARFATDPYWKDLVLFYEYFHGDTGRGLGSNHQTGWTALVARCFHRATERFQRFQFQAQEDLPQR
ncbi:MAG: MGH1-like glycoside hydrolase domain-containing protein [Candidatus Binataceae bacterium]